MTASQSLQNNEDNPTNTLIPLPAFKKSGEREVSMRGFPQVGGFGIKEVSATLTTIYPEIAKMVIGFKIQDSRFKLKRSYKVYCVRSPGKR